MLAYSEGVRGTRALADRSRSAVVDTATWKPISPTLKAILCLRRSRKQQAFRCGPRQTTTLLSRCLKARRAGCRPKRRAFSFLAAAAGVACDSLPCRRRRGGRVDGQKRQSRPSCPASRSLPVQPFPNPTPPCRHLGPGAGCLPTAGCGAVCTPARACSGSGRWAGWGCRRC